jgi:cytochrome c5
MPYCRKVSRRIGYTMHSLVRRVFPVIIAAFPIFQASTSFASSVDDGLAAFRSHRFADAVGYWTTAAQGGDVDAEYQLGLMYASGLHVSLDLEQATRYLKAAADASYGQSAYALAAIYAASASASPEEIGRLLTFSAGQGSTDAKGALDMLRIGMPPQLAVRLRPAIERQEAMLEPTLSPAMEHAPGATAAGKKIVSSVCSACHATGVAGAPVIGRRADWAARTDDLDTMTLKIIRGYKACPLKGGSLESSDDEIRLAVAYLLSRVGR